MRDPEIRDMLGMPPLAALAQRFAEALRGGELSARDMARRYKDVGLDDWMLAGYALTNATRSWRAVPQPNSAAQETVYTLKGNE